MTGAPEQEPAGWSWDHDKRLISAISMTNPVLGRYALRLVDVDAGVALDWSLDTERELGEQVSAIGREIPRRAAARERGVVERPGLPSGSGGRTDDQE